LTMSARQGSSDAILTRKYHLSEIPMFVKSGTILSLKPLLMGQTLAAARRQYDHLQFIAFNPFAVTSGSTSVYEDDGETLNYLQNDVAWTSASFDVSGGNLIFSVHTDGAFPELPKGKTVSVILTHTVPPTMVKIQGKEIPYSRFGGSGTWTYDGFEMSIIIQTAEQFLAPGDKLVVEVENAFDSSLKDDMSGLKGVIARAITAKASLDEVHITPGSGGVEKSYVSILASLADELSIAAGAKDLSIFKQLIQSAKPMVSDAIKQIAALNSIDLNRRAFAVELLQDALI